MSTESTDTLEAGNVVTVEPGIYLPGLGRRPHRGLVVVTDDGGEVLTAFPKELVDRLARLARRWPRRSTPTSSRTACTSSSTASVWRIVEFQHVKPGKGGAFVRTKLKSLESGAVVDRTFRAGEKFPRVHTEVEERAVPLRLRRRGRLHGRGDLRADRAAARATVEDALDFMQPSTLGADADRGRQAVGRPAARFGRARTSPRPSRA